MILYIDGTEYESVTYAFGKKGGLIVSKKYKVDSHESHKTLRYLDNFLEVNKITSPAPSFARRGMKQEKSKIPNQKSSLSQIVVNKGPGSFTGTRIGIAHAMALGLAWDVPVKTVSKEKFVA